MNKIAKTIGCVALAAVMGVSLAGCGGYKPKETQGITDKYIYVGNTAATTGAYAGVGVPFNYGLEAAFYAYNTNGGFGDKGLQVKLKHYDDEFSAEKGVTYTEKLVESDKVFALVGHFGTNTVAATLDYVKDIGIPTVYATTGISDLYQEGATGKDACVYPVQPIYDAEGEVLLARALASTEGNYGLGGTKIGVFSTTDDAGIGILAGIKRQWSKLTDEQKQGKEIHYAEAAAGDADYTAQATALKNAGCDVIIVATNQGPLKTFMTAAGNINLDAKFLTSYVSASAATLGDIVKSTGISESKIFATAWLDLNNYDETYYGDPVLVAPYCGWTSYTVESGEPEGAVAYPAGNSAMGECYIVAEGDKAGTYYKTGAGSWYKFNKLTEAPEGVEGFTVTVPETTVALLKTKTYMDSSFNLYTHIWSAFSEEYYDFYAAMESYCTANDIDFATYAANSYAIAGYIAGRTFLQGLERVDESGKALNWTNYREALESAPVKVAMGGSIDFANGNRFGIQDLALNGLVVDATAAEGYALKTTDVIRPLSEILAKI